MAERKVALVTGASKGIGKAIAHQLAKDGFNVVVNYNRDEAEANKIVEELKKLGSDSMAVKADISKFDECAAMADAVREKYGKMDVLVNNAGATKDKSLFNMPKEDWDFVINVNLTGAYNVTKNSMTLMKDGASIVNISSIVGLNGNRGQTNYSASKAGLIGFTKSLAKELGKRGVRVNAIAPGFIDTDMTKELSFIRRKIMLAMVPLDRAGKPEDIANVVSFLASDKAGYITGEVIRVDGGLNF
jgi:3-oxoacyl-[acyl-carrier protein] reductase